MKFIGPSLLVFTALGLVACGGQDSSAGRSAPPVPQPSKPAQTSEIVAERDFSFSTSKNITLSIDYDGQTKGAFHIYHQAAHIGSEGLIIGDPTSRITTIYPEHNQSMDLEVNNNWPSLYIHWVPMSIHESERTWAVTLNQASEHYHITF